MRINRFDKIEKNINEYYIKCEEMILDIFGDILTISSVKFSDKSDYNFKCKIYSVTEKSYNAFKILFDIIDNNSSNFIYMSPKCFAKINDIEKFCNDIKNVKL